MGKKQGLYKQRERNGDLNVGLCNRDNREGERDIGLRNKYNENVRGPGALERERNLSRRNRDKR